jgi:hypothetical protein
MNPVTVTVAGFQCVFDGGANNYTYAQAVSCLQTQQPGYSVATKAQLDTIKAANNATILQYFQGTNNAVWSKTAGPAGPSYMYAIAMGDDDPDAAIDVTTSLTMSVFGVK